MQRWPSLIIVACLCSQLALGEDLAPVSTEAKNPHSRGTAKKVIGIVLIPTAAVAGLYAMAFAGVKSGADCLNTNETGDCDRAEEQRQQETRNIAAVSVLGIASGIGLLVWSGFDSRRYRRWEEEQKATRTSAVTSANFDVGLTRDRGVVASAKWSL